MKNVRFGYEIICILDADGNIPYGYNDNEHVAVSSPLDVEFTDLSSEDVIKKQIELIDKQIKQVNADCEASITALTGRKQELLAITHQ